MLECVYEAALIALHSLLQMVQVSDFRCCTERDLANFRRDNLSLCNFQHEEATLRCIVASEDHVAYSEEAQSPCLW